ncbi:MAG TPA: hypothetical protein VGS16_16135 [Candidatus Dormibacteraeota bacterium]|nr:hypothetical protein [Candidatus Dormibacteraeota bacterium]
MSSLREQWKAGKATLGAWCTIPSSRTAEVAARSGHDWFCIDTQHGLIGYDVMLPMPRPSPPAAFRPSCACHGTSLARS